MSDAVIIALLSLCVPLVIFAIVGALNNTVRVTRLETQIEPIWKWWMECHRKDKSGG
jgi:hypothetical protein